MKKIIVLLLGIILIKCSSTIEIPKTEKIKTKNPTTPYIYINGFNKVDIFPVLLINNNDSIYINELRFNAVYSSFYTKKVMFEKFGMWDKKIRPNNERHPILIWKDRKLFENKNELFDIATSGIEKGGIIYASVIVFDSDNKDCLSVDSKIKDSIINYFSNGIKNLTNDKKFYKTYWNMIRQYDRAN
ncbi:MAG: hypothetical protein R3342_03630 [Lutibacter sp.]|uniref:hypothetical protein n=1 Tax=Lutibacter sp. TaxID=1925666 RepID=UPI00299EACD0|nr:hypothetical protein [Lutibacter sp.]MDX1828617.1 hypothetical protein [Lutibacter sp.]